MLLNKVLTNCDKKMKRIVFLSFVVLIFLSCGNDNQNYIEELEKKIEEYEAKEVANNKIKTEFCAQLETFGTIQDSLRMYETKIDSLKAEIKSKRKASKADNEALNAMLAQIDNYLAKNKELAETLSTQDFKGKNEKQIIDLLLKSLDDKEKQITMMKSEIENLNKVVAGLKVANRNLSSDLSKSISALEDKDKTIDEQNRQLATAKNLTLSNLNVKFPQGLLGDKKAKKIDNMDFCFAINYNELAEAQTITIYVRVTDEKGNLLRSSDSNLFSSDEGQIGYTVKKTVKYTGRTLNDCINWNPGKGTLKAGNYIATYYIDSHKADQKSFSMK